MRILAVETSCDETAAAVVEDGRHVLSSVVASQEDLHAEYAGVVPEIASRAHVERILPVIHRALDGARMTTEDVDAVAVGSRPGLIGSLLVGVAAAKTLAWTLDKPLIAVDHVHAHLAAGLLDAPPVQFPALGLVISGGHTSLYALDSLLSIRRLGATIDDAVGEAFDKVAAILDLGFPGGPAVDRLAESGDERAHDFPISRLDPQSLDFSFSGLKTAVLYAVRGRPERKNGRSTFPRSAHDLSEKQRAGVAASFQRAAVDAILLKLRRALERERDGGREPKALLVGGGVSANSRARAELRSFAQDESLDLRLPPLEYCVDNAAMIAALAHDLFQAGRVDDLSLRAMPTTAL